MFFDAAQIGYEYVSVAITVYPTNLNSLGRCICVYQGKISAVVGLEPDTP